MTPRKTINLEANTWSEREFADLKGVTPQAVGKAAREDGGMTEGVHYLTVPRNGKKARRYTKAASAWWDENRGGRGNEGEHGGKRGGGRPRERSGGPSGTRHRASVGEQDTGSGSEPGASGAADAEGELTLRQIRNRDGTPNLDKVMLLSSAEAKKFRFREDAILKHIERRVLEGQLMKTAEAVAAWTDRTRAAARILRGAGVRAAGELSARFGLSDAQRTEAGSVIDREIDRALSRLMGKAEEEPDLHAAG